ncbi:MAG: hypothetical protein R2932_09440 [Caldilineaceae bacterium]
MRFITVRPIFQLFFSPPLKPEGEEPWMPGDDPDIPADLIDSCAPSEDGSTLMCGDWRVLDACANLRGSTRCDSKG